MKMGIALVVLTGCSAFNHHNDPQSCRERAAYRLAEAYPSPVDLGQALAVICDGVLPVVVTTPTTPLPVDTVPAVPPTVVVDVLPTGAP